MFSEEFSKITGQKGLKTAFFEKIIVRISRF